jgi:hypothetical protein
MHKLRIFFLIFCVAFANAFQQPASEPDDDRIVGYPNEGVQITQHNNFTHTNLHRKLGGGSISLDKTIVELGSSIDVTYGRGGSTSTDYIWLLPNSLVSNNSAFF